MDPRTIGVLDPLVDGRIGQEFACHVQDTYLHKKEYNEESALDFRSASLTTPLCMLSNYITNPRSCQYTQSWTLN